MQLLDFNNFFKIIFGKKMAEIIGRNLTLFRKIK